LRGELRLQKLLMQAADGLWVAREDGQLVEANPSACELTGYTRAELLSLRIFDLDPDLDAAAAAEMWARADSEAPLYAEHRLRRKDGSCLPVELRLSRLDLGPERYLLAVARDVSARKLTEEALRESESKFRGVYENLVDVFYRTDLHGIIRMISPSVERYGYKVPDLLGRHAGQFSEALTEYDQLLRLVIEFGSIDDYELTLRRGDGTPVRASASARLLWGPDGKPCGMEGLLRDITERKQTEAALRDTVMVLNQEIAERRKAEAQLRESRTELRALSARLLSVAEEERRRISREIHDELGQMLSALTMDLSWLAQRLQGGPPAQSEKVEKMARLVDVMIESVQTIATNLRPSMLDDIGLSAAIEWLVRQFRERTKIQCRLDLEDEDMALDSERSTTVFRLIQEALTNVSRHAGATEVEVVLARSPTQVTIEIRDNGRGIRPAEVQSPTSLGLIGMRERVYRWGGRMDIEGAADKGTRLRIVIPLSITKEYSLG